MALKGRLSSNYHSGRLLPHHHTSYGVLALVLVIFGFLLLQITKVQALTESGSISLSGIVYGPPPTIPATILSPTDGESFSVSTITVSGSCGPGLLVKIWRNSILAGSTVCGLDGTFSLQISLTPGTNVLRARNYDFQDQVGPDSPDVTVFYKITQLALAPTTPQAPAPSTSFIITSPYVHKVTTPNTSLDWPFEIIGGLPPYAVLIDWGDGETSLISIKDPGKFVAKHIYRKSGTYKIRLKATDAAGNLVFFEVVAQATGTEALPQITQKPRFYDQIWPLILTWPLYIFLALLMVSFWLGEKYSQRKIFGLLKQKNTLKNSGSTG